MKNKFKTIVLMVLGLALILGISSCSKVDSDKTMAQAKFYDDELIAQYQDLANAGYALLDEGNSDSAVAKFMEMSALIPEAKYNEYNIACVYGRTGDKDEAFKWMQKMVDKGWDVPNQLYEDTDFASLLDDPRFEKIVEQSRKNLDANQSAFAERFPEYDKASMKFASEEEYNEWVDQESGKLRSHSRIWFDSQYMAVKIDFDAKRLACLRELKKDDPEFDYGLERVRAVSGIKSPYDCWGIFAESVIKEVDSYLAASPSREGAGEANFNAGYAYSLSNCDGTTPDISNKSNSYLAKVEKDTEFFGPAQTLLLANNLELAGENKDQFKDDVKNILTTYQDNKWVSRIVSTRFHDDAIKMLWPIELGLKDIDNKPVKIDQYKGKVLLIDFWATWCPPCRAELPNLLEAYEKFNSKGFDIVSISLDYEDRKPLEEYREWIEENGMDWRHIYDGKGWNAELVDKYFVGSIPAAFLVGTDGTIVGSGNDCRGENLAKSVEAALAL